MFLIKYIMSKKIHERGLIGIVFCIIVFIIGYIVLNRISTMENPPLGNTVYILIGSTLVFTSVLGIIVIIKYLYDTKRKQERKERRRKKHKLFYLKENGMNRKEDTN